jgi:hypothetical protein
LSQLRNHIDRVRHGHGDLNHRDASFVYRLGGKQSQFSGSDTDAWHYADIFYALSNFFSIHYFDLDA